MLVKLLLKEGLNLIGSEKKTRNEKSFIVTFSLEIKDGCMKDVRDEKILYNDSREDCRQFDKDN